MNRRMVSILSFGHLVNDFLINVFTAILPLLVVHFHLSYGNVGILTMASNVSSSLVQPVFGYLSDKRGRPWLLGLSALLLAGGLLIVEFSPNFVWLIPAVVLNGIGSAAFHPDGSRAVYLAAGTQRGMAQSVFQVGGNLGLAISALSLWFLYQVGIGGISWFMIPGVLSAALLFSIGKWFSAQMSEHQRTQSVTKAAASRQKSSRFGLSLLVVVVTIRSWIVSGYMTFVPLYMIHHFFVASSNVWLYSFVFLLCGAIGTLTGGPLSERLGQRNVIRFSMLISTPVVILLPYLPKSFVLPDLAVIGFCLLSTFAVTVVYGQEMLPGNIAMVSGLLIGFAGGIAGLGIMKMGYLADGVGLHRALEYIAWVMPLAAIAALCLPNDVKRRKQVPLQPANAISS